MGLGFGVDAHESAAATIANSSTMRRPAGAPAGMVDARQEGRFVFYSANYDQMNGLLGYLTENCCQGQGCATDCAPRPQLRRKRA